MKIKFILIAVLVLMAGIVRAADDCDKNLISVAGIGKVTVKPDVAYITLYANGNGLLMVDAAQKAKQKTDDIEKAIKAKHSDIKSVEVFDVSSGDKTSESWSPENKDRMPQPEVIKRLLITLAPNPQAVNEVIDAAIRAGAGMSGPSNVSYSSDSNGAVTYGLLESKDADAQARSKALDDARDKAFKLAALVGKAIGDVKSIGSSMTPFVDYQSDFFMRGATSFPAKYTGPNPNEIEIKNYISVSYELIKK